MDYATAMLIGCYVNERDKRSSARPPLEVFFRELFASLHTEHPPRVIFCDDGSTPETQAEIRRLAGIYPLETYFQPHRGELDNLRYMASLLDNEAYVSYISNDCFIRNLDAVDWLEVERSILDEVDPFVATIRAGFKPGNGEWDYRQVGNYQHLGMVTTQHFTMHRDTFDAVPWETIAQEIGGNHVGWEMQLQRHVPPQFRDKVHVIYTTPRLGMWSISHSYTPEKVRRVVATTDELEINL